MLTAPPKTIIITGISPHSTLSTQLATSLLSSLQQLQPTQGSQHSQPTISLALLGSSLPFIQQTASTLQSQFQSTHPSSTVPLTILPLEIDLTSPQSIALASHTIRSDLGAWDFLIHNAPAHLPLSSPAALTTTIRGADEDDWWSIFEVNVRSLHFIARHFFPKAKADARFVNVLSSRAPNASTVIGDKQFSAWEASALAAGEVVRRLDEENEMVSCTGALTGLLDGDVSQPVTEDGIQVILNMLF